jgi:hypothetical protein
VRLAGDGFKAALSGLDAFSVCGINQEFGASKSNAMSLVNFYN